MGGCYSNNTEQACRNAEAIDLGLGKNKDWSQLTIHSTILEDRYKRLVKTDALFFFFFLAPHQVPEVSHEEPEHCLHEALFCMIKHHATVVEINPREGGSSPEALDEALRCTLTNMATGTEQCVPPAGTARALRYVIHFKWQ